MASRSTSSTVVWLRRARACANFSKRKSRAPFSRIARPATALRSMRAMHSSVERVKLLVAAEQTGMAFQARADADQEVDSGACDHARDTAVKFVVGKPALRDIRQDERTAAVQRHAVQVIECQRQRIEVEVIGVVDQDRIVDALLHLEAHGQRRRRSERRRGIVHHGAERLDDLGIAARRGVADDRFGHSRGYAAASTGLRSAKRAATMPPSGS